jgi:hypothetical protein
MKTTVISARFLLVALPLAFLFTISFPVKASPGDDTIAFPVNIHYLGTVNSNPVLRVSFSRETNDPLTIRFLNEAGETLYRQDFSGNFFSTKFLIDGASTDDLVLTLELYSNRSRKRQVYHINNRKTILNDVVVNMEQGN